MSISPSARAIAGQASGTPLTLDLQQLTLSSLPVVGGKNAALGELMRELGAAGVRVPPGFALTIAAWHAHLAAEDLCGRVGRRMADLDPTDVAALAAAGAEVRAWIAGTPLPAAVAAAARAAYQELARRCHEAEPDVAVRSSATAEDLPTASFAGQQETYLNVRGWPAPPCGPPYASGPFAAPKAAQQGRGRRHSSATITAVAGRYRWPTISRRPALVATPAAPSNSSA